MSRGVRKYNSEYYTPMHLLERARQLMDGIDLDPASADLANRRVEAITYFTRKENGLAQDWGDYAGSVWLNPPYATYDVKDWVDKLLAHHEAGDIDQWLTLTLNASDAFWLQRLMRAASAWCFLSGRSRKRNKFWTPAGGGQWKHLKEGCMVCYGGKPEAVKLRRFRHLFNELGLIVVHDKGWIR